MTRKRKNKVPERKTASFGEHFRFFSVPFLITTILFPAFFGLLNLKTGVFFSEGKIVPLLSVGVPFVSSIVVWLALFSKRTDLLQVSVPQRTSDGIAMISHVLLSLLSLEITTDYRTNGFVASDLPGFFHTVPTFKSDLPCWFLVVFFAGNLLW